MLSCGGKGTGFSDSSSEEEAEEWAADSLLSEGEEEAALELEISEEDTKQLDGVFNDFLFAYLHNRSLRRERTAKPLRLEHTERPTEMLDQFDPEFESLQSADKVAELSRRAESASITLKTRPYEPLDLRGIFMVFICTDQPTVNAQVSNDARARRILVNNACDYLDGDFIVPARMDFGENIAVTVSTQGRAPSLAKKLKQKIQTEWAEGLEQVEKEFYES
jgi:hypothetical protein